MRNFCLHYIKVHWRWNKKMATRFQIIMNPTWLGRSIWPAQSSWKPLPSSKPSLQSQSGMSLFTFPSFHYLALQQWRKRASPNHNSFISTGNSRLIADRKLDLHTHPRWGCLQQTSSFRPGSCQCNQNLSLHLNHNGTSVHTWYRCRWDGLGDVTIGLCPVWRFVCVRHSNTNICCLCPTALLWW